MIDALIISCGEPQLKNCLDTVRNQTVPFSEIIHIDGVIPEAKAFNQGLELVKAEWFMLIQGDMILFKDAVSIVLDHIKKDEKEQIGQYHFGLYDPFVKMNIGACCVFNSEAIHKVVWKDKLRNDAEAMHRMQRKGWQTKRFIGTVEPDIVIGTHFENPSEFQIFQRFFIRGIKWAKGNPETRNFRLLKNLYKVNPKIEYAIALKAMEFGLKIKEYPGSHNLDYDKKMYQAFNENNRV